MDMDFSTGNKILRAGVLRTLDFLQVPRIALWLRGQRPFIVLYHGVTAERGEGIFTYRAKFITPDAFRNQIRWLKKRYRIVPLADITNTITSGTQLPERAVAITFDDGYKNNFTEAYRILREESVSATFFITTDFIDEQKPLPVDVVEYAIGRTLRAEIVSLLGEQLYTFPLHTYFERVRTDLALRSHVKTLAKNDVDKFLEMLITETGYDLRKDLMQSPYRPMSWKNIHEMEENGMTFAAHTRSHSILSHCTEDEIEAEIAGSMDVLRAHTKNPLPVFAYPNGGTNDFNEVVIAYLKKSRFTSALTTHSGTVSDSTDPFRISRYTLDGSNQMYRFRLMISGVLDWLARLQ
jgi:peptidoglycan/xylan/chitin deacetylase (PgdA/CDA1 family)